MLGVSTAVQANASSMISCCSTACTFDEPDDGADIARRDIRLSPVNLLGQQLGQRQAERRPCALVGRLLLHPEELLGVGVAVERLVEPPPRQRCELLDPHDRHVLALVLGLARHQLVVDLAAGHQDPLDLVAVAVAVGVGRLLHAPTGTSAR